MKYEDSDLVSVLVNLYGSQEAFLIEFQNMIAEKLLGPKEYDFDEEVKSIEYLKARFGEPNLQSCNILIKDVKESKRINNNIHSNSDKVCKKELKTPFMSFERLNFLFVSKGYWPINYEAENFKVPPIMAALFKEYEQYFSKIKSLRKMVCHNNLGCVNLSLTFDNGEFDFKCLPIHATLISYFDEESTCSC